MIEVFVSENPALEKELNIWATFYMTFNDDNVINCIEAFDNNVACNSITYNVEGIRKENFMLFQEIMACGLSKDEIIKLMPEAEEYSGLCDV